MKSSMLFWNMHSNYHKNRKHPSWFDNRRSEYSLEKLLYKICVSFIVARAEVVVWGLPRLLGIQGARVQSPIPKYLFIWASPLCSSNCEKYSCRKDLRPSFSVKPKWVSQRLEPPNLIFPTGCWGGSSGWASNLISWTTRVRIQAQIQNVFSVGTLSLSPLIIPQTLLPYPNLEWLKIVNILLRKDINGRYNLRFWKRLQKS